jgi:hypothetical protein
MVENSNIEPPRPLLDLARLATTGEVSPRRHLASRTRLLDRGVTPGRSTRSIGPLALALALGAAGFGAVGLTVSQRSAKAPPVPVVGSSAVLAPTTPMMPMIPMTAMTASPMNGATMLGDPEPAVHPDVTIEVSPESAKIFWDDELLVGNPGRVNRTPDGKTHQIRAEAPGFVTKKQSLVFNASNVSVGLELQPLPAEIGPIAVSGSLRDADAIVEGMRERFQNCYAESVSSQPSMRGSATLTVKVGPDGAVSSSEISQNSGLSARVTTCLAYVGADHHFASTASGATVRIPIAFREPK